MAYEFDPNEATGERNIITLLIDTSESMGWSVDGTNSRIDLLKNSLEAFIAQKGDAKYIAGQSIFELSNFRSTAEIAIGLFSGEASSKIKWLNLGGKITSFPYYSLQRPFNISLGNELKPMGRTPLAKSVIESIDVIEKRYQEIKMSRKNLKRPNLFLITDGKQDPQNNDLLSQAIQYIKEQERKKHLVAFGISSFEGDSSDLEKLVTRDGVFNLSSQNAQNLRALIKILSVSFKSVDNATADESANDIKRRAAANTNLNLLKIIS